jgi:hypothetical protein
MTLTIPDIYSVAIGLEATFENIYIKLQLLSFGFLG